MFNSVTLSNPSFPAQSATVGGGSGTTNLLTKKVSFNKMYEDVEVSLTAAPHLIML